jgi:two-component system, sensor histidine kinase and response regulator
MKPLATLKFPVGLAGGLLFTAVVLLHTGLGIAADGGTPLKIGVLAIQGAAQCLSRWSPTADYLTDSVPGRRFVIVPLAHDQVLSAVAAGAVDFVLSNPAMYVSLEFFYRANRILTLKEKRANGVYTLYGGVIFCRRDRTDIRRLADLVHKSFMAVSESSLGGWLMAWRELAEHGIDPYRDFSALHFGETHDQVVLAVRDGRVDAGTVRTNTLEQMAAVGTIDLNTFYVIPRLHPPKAPTPYRCTTREYPTWPLARVRHTPGELAEKVAVALLQMPPDAPAAQAAGYAGWTIPLNYQPVHDCLKALHVGPYENLGKITATDVLKRYGHWIIFASAVFCILATFTGVILKLNRHIRMSNVRLKVEMDLHRQKDRDLERAKELAEAATRAKSEFLANMSHEIRTPMNGVIAATDLAMGEAVSPKVAEYLKIIQSSAYSLLGIINDILDFSKIEAGKFELKPRTFRLNEVFDRVMELFVGKTYEKQIELLVDIDPQTPRVLIGDPLRLQQILTNLVSNACKFTDAGGVILIRVKDRSTAANDDDRVVLDFSVKDTGTGIAAEYVDRLFEPFSQADTSSTRKYEGTGLGLSICKQLVTLMDGTIGVDSQPGVGSTFFFDVRMQRPTGRTASRMVVPPDIQGLNVLVVDDLADSRTIMRKMLVSLGFRVEALESGLDALSRLEDNSMRNSPIELIMMDWKMPEMDGITVARKIRQELKLAMPIIMMTAFGKEAQRVEAEQAGINGLLIKPIYPSTLFDAIMDGFGKSGIRARGTRQAFTTRASIYRRYLRDCTILVAEDNPTNQQVARAILEGAGITVTIVGHGEAAVEAVQKRRFDAVLMDIQMPRMNGYEATQRIRQLPAGRDIPIVAMTAHAMKGDEEKCLEAGMDGYVSKPVNQDRLFHTLWRLMRTSRTDATAAWADDGDGPAQDMPAGAGTPADAGSHTGAILPDRLPGIHIRDTMAALGIDAATLTQILSGFLRDNRETVRRLETALAEDDAAPLAQLAHSLKGSAANIGAAPLSEAAHALETAASQSPLPSVDQLAERIRAVADAMAAVLQSIEHLVSGMNGAAPMDDPVAARIGAGEDIETLLSRLADAINRADPEPIAALMPALRTLAKEDRTIDPSLVEALTRQVERYDYDQALETLSLIRRPPQEAP